jgi:hypothetical protein
MVAQRGGRTFIDVESGGGPVRAPCPTWRVAKPGGANRSTEIIYIKKNLFKDSLTTYYQQC